MEEDKILQENLDNGNEELHISDVSFSLWEYGTCWVLSPIIDKKTIHKSRRNKETRVVQFYVACDNGEGYWLDFHKVWWSNFIPTYTKYPNHKL